MKMAMERKVADASFFNKSVNDVYKDLKDCAKDSLCSAAKSFDDGDFEHFKELFNTLDVIHQIGRVEKVN